MEVDALGKGKNRGKEKGGKDKGEVKGKFESKDKSHPKADEAMETRTCYYCQQAGHLAATCRKKARDEGKTDKRTTAAITPGIEPPDRKSTRLNSSHCG